MSAEVVRSSVTAPLIVRASDGIDLGIVDNLDDADDLCRAHTARVFAEMGLRNPMTGLPREKWMWFVGTPDGQLWGYERGLVRAWMSPPFGGEADPLPYPLFVCDPL
jgi:hypothetical protein